MLTNYTIVLEEIYKLSENKNFEKIKDYVLYTTKGGNGFRQSLFYFVINHQSRKVYVTSLLLELLQGTLLVIDDIMDNSELRRGQVCFYKKKGMISLRYCRYFLSVISKLIDQKCREEYYNTLFSTCIGQTLDSFKDKEYTEEMYYKIAEYKTSVYSVYFPLICGFLINNLNSEGLYKFTTAVGIIFQIQDDYLNFFPEKSKKTGNDLEEKKLTYFTYKLYREKEIKYIEEYFRSGKVSEYLIKKIYDYFPDYYEETEKLMEKLEELSKNFNRKIYDNLIEILKKRQTL